jgi:hypothetical protein
MLIEIALLMLGGGFVGFVLWCVMELRARQKQKQRLNLPD